MVFGIFPVSQSSQSREYGLGLFYGSRLFHRRKFLENGNETFIQRARFRRRHARSRGEIRREGVGAGGERENRCGCRASGANAVVHGGFDYGKIVTLSRIPKSIGYRGSKVKVETEFFSSSSVSRIMRRSVYFPIPSNMNWNSARHVRLFAILAVAFFFPFAASAAEEAQVST